MGIYDLPAMFDYVTAVTGQNRMHFIGISQSTSVYFAMASERPEYNDKIISMHALSPIALMGHMPSLIIQTGVKVLGLLNVRRNYIRTSEA